MFLNFGLREAFLKLTVWFLNSNFTFKITELVKLVIE